MGWTTRKITYNTESGSCAISPDGLTVAYGLSGGHPTDGVQVIKNYGTPVETTFFIPNLGGMEGGPYYGYGISLDNHGSYVSTTGVGFPRSGSGTGHLYSIVVISTSVVTANLVSWGNSLLTDGGVYANYFSGDGSRITNISASQIVQPFGYTNIVNRRPISAISSFLAINSDVNAILIPGTTLVTPFGEGATGKYRIYAVWGDSRAGSLSFVMNFSDETGVFATFNFKYTGGGSTSSLISGFSDVQVGLSTTRSATNVTISTTAVKRSFLLNYIEIQALDQ